VYLVLVDRMRYSEVDERLEQDDLNEMLREFKKTTNGEIRKLKKYYYLLQKKDADEYYLPYDHQSNPVKETLSIIKRLSHQILITKSTLPR
jgi:uncharacterized protein YqjF (DUF2071 family)